MCNKFKLFFIIGVLITVTGCSTLDTKTNIVYVPGPVVRIPIPKPLLVDCTVNKPTAINKYMSLTIVEKNYFLTSYIKEILTDIGKCNDKIINIRDWDKEQEELYKKKE